jgi:hypothetical protein
MTSVESSGGRATSKRCSGPEVSTAHLSGRFREVGESAPRVLARFRRSETTFLHDSCRRRRRSRRRTGSRGRDRRRADCPRGYEDVAHALSPLNTPHAAARERKHLFRQPYARAIVHVLQERCACAASPDERATSRWRRSASRTPDTTSTSTRERSASPSPARPRRARARKPQCRRSVREHRAPRPCIVSEGGGGDVAAVRRSPARRIRRPRPARAARRLLQQRCGIDRNSACARTWARRRRERARPCSARIRASLPSGSSPRPSGRIAGGGERERVDRAERPRPPQVEHRGRRHSYGSEDRLAGLRHLVVAFESLVLSLRC